MEKKNQSIDIATLVGLGGGSLLVIVAMNLAGTMLMYWDLTSVVIVIGGSVFATMIRYPMDKFIGGISVAINAFMNGVDSPTDIIDEVTELANTARKQSILALEKVEVKNKVLAQAVRYLVDGYDPGIINEILNFEIVSMVKRHKTARSIFEDLGESSPAFGMIGTVIGLIVIMAYLTDVEKIGPGLAVALITTLYGALVANLIFIPIASKLKYRSEEETVNLKIIRAGIESLAAGENPRMIREKLYTFLAPNVRFSSDE